MKPVVTLDQGPDFMIIRIGLLNLDRITITQTQSLSFVKQNKVHQYFFLSIFSYPRLNLKTTLNVIIKKKNIKYKLNWKIYANIKCLLFFCSDIYVPTTHSK